MKLEKLTIELGRSYEDHAGKYKTEIEYADKGGKVMMVLEPDVSAALMVCIGEVITKFAARASKDIERSILQSLDEAKNPKAIEA